MRMKKEEFDPPDGGLRRLADSRSPRPSGGIGSPCCRGPRPSRVELGCGKGRFTCETAAAEPEVLFVAVERVPDAMVMAMERARDLGLRNVFFVDADARSLPDFSPRGWTGSISTSAILGPPSATPSGG